MRFSVSHVEPTSESATVAERTYGQNPCKVTPPGTQCLKAWHRSGVQDQDETPGRYSQGGTEMLVVPHSNLRRLAKPLALALGLLSLLFLLQVTVHSHANGQDESACRLCQVAHLGVAPAVTALLLSVPFVSFGRVQARTAHATSETFSAHSPSRAPPACL